MQFFILVLLSFTPAAITPKSKLVNVVPDLLKNVEQKYSREPTVIANFVQIDEIKAFNKKKESSGFIRLKRPDKFRWEIRHPEKTFTVSDGKKFWFYTPPASKGDHGQLVVTAAHKTYSQLARALLTGAFSSMPFLKIEVRKDGSFFLVPKKGTAGDVESVTVTIDSKTLFVEKVALNHRGGNKSEITLSHIQLGKELADSWFEFTAPPDTDVINE